MHLYYVPISTIVYSFLAHSEETALFSLLQIKSGPCPRSLQEAVEIVLPSAHRFKMTAVGRVCSLFCHLSCLLQEVACVFLSSCALMWVYRGVEDDICQRIYVKMKVVTQGLWGSEYVSANRSASDCYSAWKHWKFLKHLYPLQFHFFCLYVDFYFIFFL